MIQFIEIAPGVIAGVGDSSDPTADLNELLAALIADLPDAAAAPDPLADLRLNLSSGLSLPTMADVFAAAAADYDDEETEPEFADGDRVTVTLTGTVKHYDGYGELPNPLRVLPDGTRNHNVVDLDAEGVEVELIEATGPEPEPGDVWQSGATSLHVLDYGVWDQDNGYRCDAADLLRIFPDATLAYRRSDV